MTQAEIRALEVRTAKCVGWTLQRDGDVYCLCNSKLGGTMSRRWEWVDKNGITQDWLFAEDTDSEEAWQLLAPAFATDPALVMWLLDYAAERFGAACIRKTCIAGYPLPPYSASVGNSMDPCTEYSENRDIALCQAFCAAVEANGEGQA